MLAVMHVMSRSLRVCAGWWIQDGRSVTVMSSSQPTSSERDDSSATLIASSTIPGLKRTLPSVLSFFSGMAGLESEEGRNEPGWLC